MRLPRLARLLALIVLVASLLPALPASAQTTGNLLENADFEGEVHGVGCCSNVPNGWTHFYRIREADKHQPWQYHEPEFSNNRNDRRRNSWGSMFWGKGHATFDAGLWQRVKLPASNGKLTLSAWMTSWSGTGDTWGGEPQAPVYHLIGIDPTGATDVWASTVVWSPTTRAALDFQQLTVSTEAKGEFATVYIRSFNELPMQRNATFSDEVRLVLETAPPPPPAPVNDQPQDERYFSQTGYRISDDAFWNYFNRRGGVRVFGYPVSRSFRLLGSEVQLFQRRVMQKRPDGSVGLLNVLDPEIMPYNSFNNAQIPGFDPALVAGAPPPTAPNYATAVLDYVRRIAPDQWNSLPVNFQRTFSTSVTPAEVFVGVPANPGLLPGIYLELWGVPTSQPAYDPNNSNFVYQRWQRGVMHYDRSTGQTQGLLLADYFKAILTGQNLPPDVAAAAQNSRFFRQYNPGAANSVARPDQLPDTNMTNAFVPGPTRP